MIRRSGILSRRRSRSGALIRLELNPSAGVRPTADLLAQKRDRDAAVLEHAIVEAFDIESLTHRLLRVREPGVLFGVPGFQRLERVVGQLVVMRAGDAVERLRVGIALEVSLRYAPASARTPASAASGCGLDAAGSAPRLHARQA